MICITERKIKQKFPNTWITTVSFVVPIFPTIYSANERVDYKHDFKQQFSPRVGKIFMNTIMLDLGSLT